mgnify:CR=1 FL=1
MKILKRVITIFMFIICIIIFIQVNKVLAVNDTSTQNEELTYKKQENGEILISGFKIGEKVSDILKRKFADGYIIKVKNNKDIDITNNPDIKIGTGNKVELYLPNEDVPKRIYTIVIYGDTNGDSNIEAVDALAIIKNKIGTEPFTNIVLEEAGRIQNETRENGAIPKAADALSLIKYKLYPETYIINQKLKQPDKEIIKVEFNANGGILNQSTKNIIYKCTYGELPTPTRQGYNFIGWFTQENEGTKIENTTIVDITEDHTIYAHWEKNSYTLTVNHYLENAEDENYKLSTTTTYKVLYDTKLTLESLKTTIENGTYKYASLSENGTETINYQVKADTTIYIYYSRNTYTVTLQAGQNITKVSGGGKCKIGASIPIDATFIKGYDSVQWTIIDGYGNIDDWKVANTTVTPERNMTLEANAQEAFVQVGKHFYSNIMMAKSMEDLSRDNKIIKMSLLKSRKICTTEDNVKGIYFWKNNGDYVLDLGKNTLTLDEDYIIYVKNGKVEIKNGKIILKNEARIINNSTLILSSVEVLGIDSNASLIHNYENANLTLIKSIVQYDTEQTENEAIWNKGKINIEGT